jgi:hypothetical protein
MSRNLYLSQLADLSDVVGHAKLLCPSVGPAGEAVFLLARGNDAQVVEGRDEQLGWASFPHSRTEHPVDAEIVIHNGRRVLRRIGLGDVPLAHPLLQPLPSGTVILVGAQCRRFQDGSAEQNARVYSAEGDLLREFVLGDGLQDLQATASGQIWAS